MFLLKLLVFLQLITSHFVFLLCTPFRGHDRLLPKAKEHILQYALNSLTFTTIAAWEYLQVLIWPCWDFLCIEDILFDFILFARKKLDICNQRRIYMQNVSIINHRIICKSVKIQGNDEISIKTRWQTWRL